jgi:ribosomal protein L11 methyltransferase
MPWLEVSIAASCDAAAAIEEALAEAGALAVTLQDEADQAVFEPEPGSTPLWPMVQITGLFPAASDRGFILDRLQVAPGVAGGSRIRWREVEDRDWERAWLDRFAPMRFGRRLWIVPTGMDSAAAAGSVKIHLDPGLAFGTGTHPTTALCLEWLDAQILTGRVVVDFGCGSGVLGIAAALLGAERVVCVDNDPQALEATAANAERNGVSDRLEISSPADFGERAADAVVANILAAPLVRLAPALTDAVRPGGRVVLSGLLEQQAAEVVVAYEPGCDFMGRKALEGWLRLEFRKRG